MMNLARSTAMGLPGLAAIVYQDHGHADELLLQTVRALQQRGVRLGGVIQDVVIQGDAVACSPAMRLRDVRDLNHPQDSRIFSISQELGRGSSGCCLDERGVAEASCVLRDALIDRPDLVVVNRFGKLESLGQGFHAELIALVEAGLPLLTAVRSDHLPAWRDFVGGDQAELPPVLADILAWCKTVHGGASRRSRTLVTVY